jgi:hypothetical protein
MGDLSSYEFQSTARRLMIEEDPRTGKYSIAFAIIHRYIMPVDFCDTAGTLGIKGSLLILGNFLHFAKHFAA